MHFTKFIVISLVMFLTSSMICLDNSLAQTKVIRAIQYKQITNFETNLKIGSMKMSADGSRIVFATGGESKKIFTINTDGTGLTQVYHFEGATGNTPYLDISADGEVIIWCDWVGDGEIFISFADGSFLEKIVTLLPNPVSFLADMKPKLPFPPRLTANGSEVYFIHKHGDPHASGLWRVKSDGTELKHEFNYVEFAKKAFGKDVSNEYDGFHFDSGFDISADGYTVILGTIGFKLKEGIRDVGDAVVYHGSNFYNLGEYAVGGQPFATFKDGNQFIISRREFNETTGTDEINIYYDTPGTGDPIKVVSGLDIFGYIIAMQMSGDGSSAIVLGANGHLPITWVNRITQSRLDVISIDELSIAALGGFRFSQSSLPSINWNGNRFCFLTTYQIPPQIWVADIGSDGINTQPSITEVSFEPDFVLLDGSTKTTFKAHVMSPPYSIPTVTFATFKDGVYHFRALICDWPYWGKLLDNGELGDETANDGYFCNNSIYRDLSTTPPGYYTIRIAAVDATLRHVTMIEAEPFEIRDESSSIGETYLIPVNYGLHQNQPNPFNSNTKIEYSVPRECFVQIKVYDILGNEVANLVNELKGPEKHAYHFNSNKLKDGIYFYEMKAGDFRDVKKMIVIK